MKRILDVCLFCSVGNLIINKLLRFIFIRVKKHKSSKENDLLQRLWIHLASSNILHTLCFEATAALIRIFQHFRLATKKYDVNECALHVFYWVNQKFKDCNWIGALTDIHKEIGHEELHCGTNISIFSLTWAGLAVFFKAEFI